MLVSLGSFTQMLSLHDPFVMFLLALKAFLIGTSFAHMVELLS